MTDTATITLPGESPAYRLARNELLAAERDLRRQVETVAAMRRALPPGGPLKEDYLFSEASPQRQSGTVRLSELFAPGKDCLVIYGFMFASSRRPCPMCCSFLDSFDGAAPHISERVNLAVVAKAGADEVRSWAEQAGWQNLRLLSSAENDYNSDYLAENAAGDQLPIVNVFQKTPDGIRHRYASELFFAPSEEGQNPRHVDLLWPLWNTLDLTPEGRGDWYPSLDYGLAEGS